MVRPPRRRPSTARLVLFTLLTPILALAAVEGSARGIEAWTGGPGPIEARSPCYFQQIPVSPPLRSLDEVFPGAVALDPSWVDNDHQVVHTPKPDDELRIVMIGGSALGGWGLPSQAQLSGVVERLLDPALPGRKVRVLNLGMTGWGSAQLAYGFEEVAKRIDADLVVTVMGNNERLDLANAIVLSGFQHETLFARRAVLRTSALLRWIEPAPPHHLDMPPLPMPEVWDLPMEDEIGAYVARRLGRTVKRLRKAAGAPMVVCSVPVNHRYHRRTREWWFVGEAEMLSEPYRTAHWAWSYDAPDAGIKAMTERLAEQPEDAAATVIRGWLRQRGGDLEGSADDFAAALDLLGSLAESEQRLLTAWAVHGAEGPAAAQALIAPWVEEERGASAEFQRPCGVADLLWYAGDEEAAAPAYEACLLHQYYYRADPVINEGLRAAAARAGAEFYDLDGAIRARSPHGVPGFESFYDYCHYTPRGAVLAGHLIAAAIAPRIGIDPASLPSPEDGVAAYGRLRAGRTEDLPALEEWVGASWDVTLLTQLRLDLPSERRGGDDQSALGMIFAANSNAATSSLVNLDATRLAIGGYLAALEVEPEHPVARANLASVLATDAGRLLIPSDDRGDLTPDRVSELLRAEAASPGP